MRSALTKKDEYELRFWRGDGQREMAEHRETLQLYLRWFGEIRVDSVLEIGIGPGGGIIQHVWAHRHVALDPLIPEYVSDCGLILHRGVEYVAERFEDWKTDEQFDAIISTNTIDHGELGFHILPRLGSLLKPGGKLYLHVHLRPIEMLNAGHDHSLTLDQLHWALVDSKLVEVKREVFDADLDGWPCKTLMGIWKRDD